MGLFDFLRSDPEYRLHDASDMLQRWAQQYPAIAPSDEISILLPKTTIHFCSGEGDNMLHPPEGGKVVFRGSPDCIVAADIYVYGRRHKLGIITDFFILAYELLNLVVRMQQHKPGKISVADPSRVSNRWE